MIEGEPENNFALRVWFMTDYADVLENVVDELQVYAVELTPSNKLSGISIIVTEEQLPKYITQPIALLKMLGNGGRIPHVGKKIAKDLFYVYVHVDQWLEYTGDKTKEK